MTTVSFSLGISLFVLLIVDITSYPLPKGIPQSPPQNGINSGGTANFETNFRAAPGRYLPAFTSSNVYMSGSEGGPNQPILHRGPESSVGVVAAVPEFSKPPQSIYDSSTSMPAQPGYFADSYMSDQPGHISSSNMASQPRYAAGSSFPRFSSAASTQSGGVARGSRPAQPVAYSGTSKAASQGSGALRSDVGWVVPPPVFSGNQHASSHPSSSAGHNHGPAHAGDGQLLPEPPRPMYQPGQLSHFENNAESGNFERETEEIGYPSVSSSNTFLRPPGVVFTSPGGRGPGAGGMVRNRFPYFDYMFLTGQYPPGTVSHFTTDFEHGRDYYQNTHYNKEHAPDPGSNQQTKMIAEPPD